MTWTFLWLMVALKIPVIAAIWLVWWAIKQEPTAADGPASGDGGSRVRPSAHPRPRLPHSPRRGPHGSPAPPAPPRVRSVTARARSLHR